MTSLQRGLIALTVALALIFVPQASRADTKEVALKSVGALTIAFFYQTQVSIGMLADAKAKELYEAETCSRLLQLSINFTELLEKQMTELLDEELDESDAKTLEQFQEINGLLKRQALSLNAFWKQNRESDKAKYLETRGKVQMLLDKFGE